MPDADPDRPLTTTTTTAWPALARAAQKAGQLQQARQAASEWTRLAPFDGSAWLVLGQVAARLGDSASADAAFANAVACAPQEPGILAAAASHHLAAADYGLALPLLQRAHHLRPRDPSLIGAYTVALERAGRRDQARAFVEDQDPELEDANFVNGAARVWTRSGQPDRAVALLRRTLGRARLAPSAVAFLEHQLGAALASMGDHDGAFAAHTRGNRARRYTWSRRTYTAFTEAVLPYVRRFEGGRNPTPQGSPILIVGMPRSGSTLLETILTMIGGVETVGEATIVHDAIQPLADRAGRTGLRPFAAQMTDAEWGRIAEATARRYREAVPGAVHIVDKMLFNFDRLDLVARMFPGARVLVTTRHPYDTCLSCYFQNFDARLAFTRDLADLGHVYATHQRFLDAASNLPLHLREVRYADVVQDLEGTIRGVTDWLGLTFDPACLAFHTNPRPAATASYDQVRQPLYRTSVGRWRPYAKHLGPLFDELPAARWAPDALELVGA